MTNPENDNKEENEENKKTVYKETEDSRRDEDLDNGDTSSASGLGRTDFNNRASRTNKPLGSSHEPGTL